MKRDVSENSTKSIECFLSMNTDQKNMETYIFKTQSKSYNKYQDYYYFMIVGVTI